MDSHRMILAQLLNWASDRIPMGSGCSYCGWPERSHTSECALVRLREWAEMYDPEHKLDGVDGIKVLLPEAPTQPE